MVKARTKRPVKVRVKAKAYKEYTFGQVVSLKELALTLRPYLNRVPKLDLFLVLFITLWLPYE